MHCGTLLTILPEEMLAVLAGQSDVGRDVAAQLDDVSEVVLVPAVVLATVGLKQVVSCNVPVLLVISIILLRHSSVGPNQLSKLNKLT